MDGCLSVDGSEDRLKVFKKPLRKLCPGPNGTIFCGSANGFVASVDRLDGGEGILWRTKISEDAISALLYLPDIDVLAVGDDKGDVIFLDPHDPANILHRGDYHSDYVADFAYNGPKKTLVSASGDGSILAIDVKRHRVVARSEDLEDEIVCMAMSPDGARLYCGTLTGVINIFNWGYFGVPSGRIKSFRAEINCLAVLGSRDLLVATSDHHVHYSRNERKTGTSQKADQPIESIACIDGQVYGVDQDGVAHSWPLSGFTSVVKDSKDAPKEETECDQPRPESFFDGLQ